MIMILMIHSQIFRVDEHAPLKFKKVRANQPQFMTKELSKCKVTRSNVRNKNLT